MTANAATRAVDTATSGTDTATQQANTPTPAANTVTWGLRKEVERAREVVEPALRAAVGELEPATRDVISYHLGWMDQHGREVAGGGGKALRPALAVLSAQAVGADPAVAVPGAAAVELVHNFSLLHDDVMDGDAERRRRPTVWWLYGVPTAILAGDALLTLAVDVVERAGNHEATSCVTGAVRELISGQTRDVGFEQRDDVGLDECLDMADGKTGALMYCASRVGPLLARAPAESSRALGEFGRHLGMAFQLVDDLLGIRGDPAVTGKPVRSDLRARKKTVPVVAALNSDTASGAEFAALYSEDAVATEEDLLGMAELIERSGALSWTEAEADRHIRTAREHLDRVGAPPAIRETLHQFATFITERDK